MSQVTILIDPGHGGKDPGAVKGGIKEKELNLYISCILKGVFHYMYPAVKVLMTRYDDVYLSLKQRVDMAYEHNVDLLLSVHCNAGGGRGFESYIGEGTSYLSACVQGNIHQRLKKYIPEYGIVDRGPKKGDFYVISRFPNSVLLELGFIDNWHDLNYLGNPAAIADICHAVVLGCADAFQEYRNSNKV